MNYFDVHAAPCVDNPEHTIPMMGDGSGSISLQVCLSRESKNGQS